MLYAFNGLSDGALPVGNLIFDAAGNLYGATSFGGTHRCQNLGCGSIFELTPDGMGGWTFSVLYDFSWLSDGGQPRAGLTFDGEGNLYGTAQLGGDTGSCRAGCGVVFSLSKDSQGGWDETVLHAFHGNDGQNPDTAVAIDAAGNVYGTTPHGGEYTTNCMYFGCGTAFRLSRNGNGGQWRQTILHAFSGGLDGSVPT